MKVINYSEIENDGWWERMEDVILLLLPFDCLIVF